MALPIVGIMGQKRSGKDTFGALLCARQGFERFAFADALKAAALRADPFVPMGDGGFPWRLSEVVDEFGWERAKERPETRRFLQDLGLAVRALDEDFWLRAVMDKARPLAAMGFPVVITDVRFPNEAAAIRATGGVMVRVERPGLADDDRHVSENAWRGERAEFVIDNSGTVEDLHPAVDFVGSWVKARHNQ